MKIPVRNILSLIGGVVLGGLVNMGLITISSLIIPLPDGADISSMQALEDSIHLFQPRHFIMPFLAHALGTLAGSAFTAFLCTSDHLKWCLTVGVFFLMGGITNVVSLPSPLWFNIVDLTLAYLPMAYVGWKLFGKK